MRGGREEEEKGEEAAARQEVECGGLAQPAPSRPRWRREKNICICVTSPRVCVHRLVRRLHSINQSTRRWRGAPPHACSDAYERGRAPGTSLGPTTVPLCMVQNASRAEALTFPNPHPHLIARRGAIVSKKK